MSEAEVVLRLAEYLLKLPNAASSVEVAIDGAVVKIQEQAIFDIEGFLTAQGWKQTDRAGRNAWSGTYQRHGKELRLSCRSGEADVIIEVGARRVVAECKGGTLLRKRGSPERPRLAQVLGQALGWNLRDTDLLIVAVPDSEGFRKLTSKYRERPLLVRTGIQICLVNRSGTVTGFTLPS
jgi:hypothetical protein